MNKTLILALTIAISSFGCADEDVATISTPDEPSVSSTQTKQLTTAITDDAINPVSADATIAANAIEEASSDAHDLVEAASSTAINDIVVTTDKVATTTTEISFTDIDSNLDGEISQQEAQIEPTLADVFTQLDEDNTGSLSEVEYQHFAMLIK